MNKKLKIAIDIDEVVVKFMEHYIDFVVKKGVKRVNLNDIYCYDIAKVLNMDYELFMIFLDEFNEKGGVFNFDFIEGACEGIFYLKKKYDINFITARFEKSWEDTRAFIFEKFRITGDKVIFSKKLIGDGERKDKICKFMEIDLIIEDSPSSLVYAENGIKVLLLDKPWNQGISHKNLFRCKSWDEILEKVGEIDE